MEYYKQNNKTKNGIVQGVDHIVPGTLHLTQTTKFIIYE